MSDFSLDIKTAFLKKIFNQTDINCSQFLEDCHVKFLDGDRVAIMTALIACSFYTEGIPSWVAEELKSIDDYINNRKFNDVNEFFGFKQIKKPDQKKLHSISKHKDEIIQALVEYKLTGGTFSNENGDFRYFVKKLSERLNVTQELIKEIYAENSGWLQKIEKGSKHCHGNTKIHLLKPRRTK